MKIQINERLARLPARRYFAFCIDHWSFPLTYEGVTRIILSCESPFSPTSTCTPRLPPGSSSRAGAMAPPTFSPRLSTTEAMKTFQFTVVTERDEDGRYAAICPALPCCYTEGRTEAEASSLIEDAMRLHIEDREVNGAWRIARLPGAYAVQWGQGSSHPGACVQCPQQCNRSQIQRLLSTD